MFSFGCILVHSRNFMVWKQRFQFRFNLFCSEAFGVQCFTSAGNATLHHRHIVAALMAAQLVFMLMECQTNIAIRALGRNAASGAFYNWRKTSSILEKNNLFAIF